MPEPWEPGYKPPSAAEAFDESRPLPRSALAALDYINRKDEALQAAEARVAELEAALEAAAEHFEMAAVEHDCSECLRHGEEASQHLAKGKEHDG